MFNLKTIGLVLVCCCFLAVANAQHKIPLNEPNNNKPRLFNNLPEKIAVKTADLESMFQQSESKTIALRVQDGKVPAFRGEVLEDVTKYEGALRSIVIRSADYSNATICISAVKQEGGIVYTGRITSLQHGDVLELKKIDDSYYFVKRDYYKLINE